MTEPDERRRLEAKRIEQAIFRVRLAEAFRRRAVVVWGWAGVLLAVGALVAGASLWGNAGMADRVLLHGALIPERVSEGEWWRMLSGTLLHKSWPHLVVNLVGLLLIGRHVEVAFGRSGFMSLYVGASMAGAVGTIAADQVISVGASGAIFGLGGALVALGLRLWRSLSPELRRALVGVPMVVLSGMLLLGVWGNEGMSADTTDGAAHVGGTIGGLALGLVLPLRLRDKEGRALTEEGSRWARRYVTAMALFLGALVVGAGLMVAQRSDVAPQLAAPATRTLHVQGAAVLVPTALRSGVWRSNECQGDAVDPTWTLSTRRVACFQLPMGGLLLVGEPQRMLTLDPGDVDALRRARDERRFVWRQSRVLVAPAGGRLVFAVLGHEGMLAGYTDALAPLLPAADTVTLPDSATQVEGGVSAPGLAGSAPKEGP